VAIAVKKSARIAGDGFALLVTNLDGDTPVPGQEAVNGNDARTAENTGDGDAGNDGDPVDYLPRVRDQIQQMAGCEEVDGI